MGAHRFDDNDLHILQQFYDEERLPSRLLSEEIDAGFCLPDEEEQK